MDVTAEYLDAAFDKMLEVARRCGRHLDRRPFGEGTNSVGALVVHCCEVAEFWLGHVALGRASARRREREFTASVTLAELEELLGERRVQVRADLARLRRGEGRPSEARQFLVGGGDDDSVVLHVLEELYQHLGHMDLTVDALRAAGLVGEPLYHLAVAADWEAAVGSASGTYEVSTVGRTLAEEGFIHCSFDDQVADTARRYYSGRSDVVLLRLESELVEELLRVEATPDGTLFPHLYGPLPVAAVAAVHPLEVGADGVPQVPASLLTRRSRAVRG